MARMKLHLRHVHKNPLSSKTKRRAAKLAGRLAYRIWQHVKTKGYAIPIPKRTPKMVKTYVRAILKANKINWTVGLLLALFASQVRADQAAILQDANGRPVAIPIVTVPTPPPAVPPPPPIKTVQDTASLPPVWPNTYIYFSLPGNFNLVTPWSAGILAEGYDVVGHEAITQGYLPLFQWWKITGVLGGGINGRGDGSPLGGAIVDLAHVPISSVADFHSALSGGYNLNAHRAMAVLSASVQFLK